MYYNIRSTLKNSNKNTHFPQKKNLHANNYTKPELTKINTHTFLYLAGSIFAFKTTKHRARARIHLSFVSLSIIRCFALHGSWTSSPLFYIPI